ncbi:hypothetical protein [Flavobacterium capsici]|uniref:Uncharacterized protein n=1 Tax=Flavobacterium capsici TaxID=3075618 RepID=A0AA96EYS7_9FLAO|nr:MULTISPECIES: hypothetical protein [unclassified Flavobacterium]WNM17930.1 hypothetical protein RN608_07880 [Flavobacterium sp. PMR2A8]WNM21982.1 hypothetical protein RN605_01180 [Flavobacterium sp. PMTSA4]
MLKLRIILKEYLLLFYSLVTLYIMARLGNKKNFKGLVGNVVFREQDGMQIVQSRATNVKQSKATKSCATEFGNCSKWAKQLRIGLTPFLLGMTDNTMHQRLTTAIYSRIKGTTGMEIGTRTPFTVWMEPMGRFEYNLNSPFENYFRPNIYSTLNAAHEVTVLINDFVVDTDVTFPLGCSTADLVILIQATTLEEGYTPLELYITIPVNKGTVLPEDIEWVTEPMPPHHLITVSAKLYYYNLNTFSGRNYLNTKTFSPAQMILIDTTHV